MALPSLLVVDAIASNVRLAELTLGKAGYTLYKATNADDALRLLEACSPSLRLILMNMYLRHSMDGIALTRIIRAMPAWHTVPIIATSSDDTPSHRRTVLGAGCTALLLMPLNYPQLVSTLTPYLAPITETP